MQNVLRAALFPQECGRHRNGVTARFLIGPIR